MRIHRSTVEDIILVAMLTFAPLALGAVHIWAFSTLAFLALALFGLRFLSAPDSFKAVIRRPESIGAAAFLMVSLLYITPMPPEVVKALSPNTWDLWQNYTIEAPRLMTLSIYAHATTLYIIKFVTYLMVFLVVVSKLSGQQGHGSWANSVVSRQSSGVHREGNCTHDSRPTTHDGTLAPCFADDTHDPRHTTHDGTLAPYILLGALCSGLSILFHSFSDFNLHIPANALYFTVMCAIVAGLSRRTKRIAHGFGHGSRVTGHGSREGSRVMGQGSWVMGKLSCQSSGGQGEGGPSKNEQRKTINERFVNTAFLSFLTNTIISIGFAVALFGIIQKLSYNGKIYWVIKKAGSHFGPYINYDHAAGFLEMCAIFTIAVFVGKVACSGFAYTRKLKDKILWLFSKEANTALVYLFIAIVMTTALFMTTSRGGIMSFLGALAVLYFACVITAQSKIRNRILLATALVLILAVIMIAWVGPEETINRFAALRIMIDTFIRERAILNEIRPYMWKDTISLIQAFPLTGVGLGDYVYIFPKFRTFSDTWGLLQFAHNDYLHFIAEMGAIGAVFLAGFLLWFIRRFVGCLRRLKAK